MQLHLLANDSRIDLIDARVDLAIRFGALEDSQYIATRLVTTPSWVCAAPDWVRRHGPVSHPQDMTNISLLNYEAESRKPVVVPQTLQFHRTGEAALVIVQVPIKVCSYSHPALHELCLQGVAPMVIPQVDAQAHIQSHELVRLLPEWNVGHVDVWAITPHRKTQSVKVREATEQIKQYLRALHK